ncbi:MULTISPECIES: hypothetical protein [unclassified Cryobacterium]|uniref:hypothetical protein n=1 Tax=unclassified Cryobacterium TaxID=2649013 RepID=UPI000CE4AF98|nr:MULTISPECIES: hypothetical protein [unclassified Cryobacterium]
MHPYQIEHNGETIERKQFVPKKIGHDLAHTNYEVDRARHAPVGAEHDTPATHEAGPTRAGASVLGL